MNRVVASHVLGTVLVLGCDAAPTASTLDFGTCVPLEPTSVEIEGVRFSLDVEPEIMGYRDPTLLTLTLTNLSTTHVEVEGPRGCLVEKWIRGESLVAETTDCWVPFFQRGPGGSTAFSTSQALRPPGSPRRRFRHDPAEHYMGPEAPPGTYCVVAEILLDTDTVRLEAPFQLVDHQP